MNSTSDKTFLHRVARWLYTTYSHTYPTEYGVSLLVFDAFRRCGFDNPRQDHGVRRNPRYNDHNIYSGLDGSHYGGHCIEEFLSNTFGMLLNLSYLYSTCSSHRHVGYHLTLLVLYSCTTITDGSLVFQTQKDHKIIWTQSVWLDSTFVWKW